jgi:hypothetical protein
MGLLYWRVFVIERDYPDEDQFIISCDTCSTEDTLDTDEFIQAVSMAKQRGWLVEMIGGEWIHKCPSCANKVVKLTF